MELGDLSRLFKSYLFSMRYVPADPEEAKKQIAKAVEDLKVGISWLPNGPQVVSLIDWTDAK